MSTEIERRREERERRLMDETTVDKAWTVPARADKGTVTIALRLPEVRVTDSEGRQIVLAPEQAELVSSKLGNIADWLHHGDHDWEDVQD
jgi:hypothetical protein